LAGYFADGKQAKVFAPIIEEIESLIVSTINLYEVGKKVSSERGKSSAHQVVAFMRRAMVADVNADIALHAAQISLSRKLPMADSLIYATAQHHDATVWTLDSDFSELEGVRYFAKK
jgi:toxin FitB